MQHGIRFALMAPVAGAVLLGWVVSAAAPVAPAPSTIHTFHFRLYGFEEVPPVNTPGAGWATVTLDDVTGDVTVTGEFQCLVDNVRAAHIHGPATPGQNAPALITLNTTGTSSGTFGGSGTLDAQGIQDMLNGMMYINVHTFVNFPGEIRGQITACASPSVTVANGSGTNPLTLSSNAGPQIGTNWSADLDCSAHAPGIAALWFHSRPSPGSMIGAGEVLLNLSSKRLTKTAMAHTSNVVTFNYAIPNDTALCGLAVHAQGVVTGSPGVALSNRLDLVSGL